MLFVDNVLMFGMGMVREWRSFKRILNLFCLASRMVISEEKYVCLSCNLEEFQKVQLQHLLTFKFAPLDFEIKYLGFYLKANDYRVED